jgi:hypothetical protein
MFESIKKFFGPVHNSEKGTVKGSEVARASILGVVSASSIWAILSVIWALVQSIITDPNLPTYIQSLTTLLKDKNYVAIFIAVTTFILDFLRRKYSHGS